MLLNQIQAESSIFLKDIIITYKNKEINIYNQKNLQIIKNIQNGPYDLAISSISSDEKYLAVKSFEDNCIIFNLQNQFDIIKTIQTIGDIISVAFSSDGKQLAISTKYLCNLWNVNEGFSLLQQQIENNEENTETSFTDGRYFIFCFYSGCKIYDSQQKLYEVYEIKGHNSEINQVAISSINQYIASCSDDVCNIWSIQNGQWQVNQIKGHNEKVNKLAFSGDSKYLAAAEYSQTIQIWNIEKDFSLHHTLTLEANSNVIKQFTFSRDSKYLAILTHHFIIWNVDKGFQLLYKIYLDDYLSFENLHQLTPFAFDGKQIAISSRESQFCKVFNIQHGIELKKNIQEQNIDQVAFSPNGKYLATNDDGVINIWSVEKEYELLDTIQAHSDSIKFLVFSANSKYLISSTNFIDNDPCKIWNVDKGFQLFNTIQIPQNKIISVAFSQDSNQLIIGTIYNFTIWNLEKGFESIQMEVKDNIDRIQSVAFSSDGKLFATTYDKCQKIKIWSTERGFELINMIQPYNNKNIQYLTFSSDGNYLVTLDETQKDLTIWSVEKGFKLIDKIQELQFIYDFAISTDSMFLATLTYESINIWNIQNQFQLITTIPILPLDQNFDIRRSFKFSFSLNEKYLFLTQEQKCNIFDVKENFKQIHTIVKGCYFTSVTISSDGKYLATSRDNEICEIWSIKEKFNLVKTIMILGVFMNSVIFSADSKYLAIYSKDQSDLKLDQGFCEIRNAENEFSLITRINFPSISIKKLEFSSDNKYLAVNLGKYCKIYNIQKEFEIMNLNEFEDSQIKSAAVSQLDSQLSNGLLDKLVKHNKIFQQIYEL